MEYFGIKYTVKNNIVEVNTLTTFLILWNNYGFVVGDDSS